MNKISQISKKLWPKQDQLWKKNKEEEKYASQGWTHGLDAMWVEAAVPQICHADVKEKIEGII